MWGLKMCVPPIPEIQGGAGWRSAAYELSAPAKKSKAGLWTIQKRQSEKVTIPHVAWALCPVDPQVDFFVH